MAAAVVIGVEAVVPRVARAQLELGPRLGIYVPSGFFVNESPTNQSRGVGAPLIGGQALVRVTRWLNVEAAVGLSPSMVAVSDSSGTNDHTSTVVLASTRALVPITSRRGLWSFFLGAGVGIVARMGGVWTYSSGTTRQTWVVLFGGRTELAPNLAMRFELESNFSTEQFDRGLPTQTQPQKHQDFVFAVAIDLPLHHR